MGDDEILRLLLQTYGVNDGVALTSIGTLNTEMAWAKRRKPFFNVHATVVRGLANTSLAIKPSSVPRSVVHELSFLCVKFPIGIDSPLLAGVEHFYISLDNCIFDPRTGSRENSPSMGLCWMDKDACYSYACLWGESLEDVDKQIIRNGETEFESKQRHFIARIGLGVMLLAADPEFIKPVLLKRDQGRTADIETLTKRAHQRGLVGYEIGADMEVSPHFRRPHFAIRWTGKGATVPKLVPVKGAIIHKSKMQEIPTGYEMDERGGRKMTFPPELTSLHQWMLWRNEIPPEGGEPRKIPYQPNGLKAKSNDPATWHSYEECVAVADSFAGLAFVFSELDPYCGIDLDDCVSGGEIEPWAQEIIAKFSGRCYAEISPSGCGVKLIAVGNRDNTKHKNKVGSVECYDRSRFWTMTGFVLDGETTIGDAQDAIDWLGDKYLKRPAAVRQSIPATVVGISDEHKLRRASAYLATIDPAISGAGGDHQTFVAACRMLIGFDLTPSQAFSLLWNEYNPRCVPEWTEAELWHKVRQAEKQGGQRGELLNKETLPSVDISGLLNPSLSQGPLKRTRKKSVETIPEQCLRPPGILSAIIDYTLRTSIYPQPELALAGAIALLATVTGRKLTDSYGTRTNVYVLGLAPSGSGKEQARKTNKTLLQLAGAARMIGNERLGSSAGLITSIAESPATLIQIDEIGRLLLTMKHPEKSPHLYNIGTVLMQLYACSDALWIGDAYADAKRVKRIEQPHAVLYGTAPPEGFWESLTAENVTDGLLGRVLAIQSATGYSDPQKPERCDPPIGLIDAIRWWVDYKPGGNCQDIGGENATPSPLCVEYSPEASERFDAHMLAISQRRKDDEERAAAIWSRSAGKAGKLALIFAASRCPCSPLFRVEREDIDRGIALANFLTRQTLRKVGEHVSDNHWEASTKRVLRLLEQPLTKSQLTKKTQWLKKRERDDILTTLLESEQIEMSTRETGGRVPVTVFSRQEFNA